MPLRTGHAVLHCGHTHCSGPQSSFELHFGHCSKVMVFSRVLRRRPQEAYEGNPSRRSANSPRFRIAKNASLILSWLGRSRLSQITQHPDSKLDSSRFPSQDKPEKAYSIDCEAHQQIQNELRITVSIKRSLHQHQGEDHGEAKNHRKKIGLDEKFSDRYNELPAHMPRQKK